MRRTIGTTGSLKGAMLTLLSCGFITITDAVAKIVLTRIPVGQVILIRGAFLFAILLVVIGVSGKSRSIFRWDSLGSQVLCGAFQVAAAWCFFGSLSYLPFSVVVTAAYTNPLFLVLLSSWILSERVGVARAGAVVIGFFGIVIVAQPQGDISSLAIVLPIGSALFGAFRDVWMRRLTKSDSSLSILLFSQLLLTLSGIPPTVIGGVALTWQELGMLALMAAGMGLAVFWSIEAFRYAEASFVAPFRFSGLLWAPLVAFLIWNEIPTAAQVIGMALVGMGGVLAVLKGGTVVRTIEN